ncbi:DNA polymerase-4 [Desulfacinum hydrothermale DSM 13146]|uniref:DNA polymerase-4 n=1 Tax=Desulfacinum hydrothermale DSM 13146 TaxID=1121390 RepID=A0A1W1X030_9BACT|nr:hypothetical protein [Desulfacinum hydrothermale]SMC17254.1 DNA polymerase-4 [Desulfacinum hydrothermale DSM 13146]
MERTILHIQVPDFCAVLEALRDPSRAHRPLAVADPTARSVVQAVNHLARREGIREGMPLAKARRRCRGLQVVPCDRSFYKRAHDLVARDLAAFSPLVEGAVLGRFFVDLTGTRRLWGPATDTACRLEDELLARRRLAARAGVAPNKLVSQAAAACVDVGDVSRVFPGGERAFLEGLPVTALPGIGPGTASILGELNVRRVGELAGLAPAHLFPVFGRRAERLIRLARGEDPLPVVPLERKARLEVARALPADEIDRGRLEIFLFHMVEEAGWVLRRQNRVPGRVRIVVGHADGVERTATRRLPDWNQILDRVLFGVVRDLFRKVAVRRVAVRKMAVEWLDLRMPLGQLCLFSDRRVDLARERRIQAALDAVRSRFGRSAVRWGLAGEG